MLWFYMFFFFKDPAPTRIYPSCHTLSRPDALPFCLGGGLGGTLGGTLGNPTGPIGSEFALAEAIADCRDGKIGEISGHYSITFGTAKKDRKSTRLNSSH